MFGFAAYVVQRVCDRRRSFRIVANLDDFMKGTFEKKILRIREDIFEMLYFEVL